MYAVGNEPPLGGSRGGGTEWVSPPGRHGYTPSLLLEKREGVLIVEKAILQNCYIFYFY